jgi:hypothetical protein
MLAENGPAFIRLDGRWSGVSLEVSDPQRMSQGASVLILEAAPRVDCGGSERVARSCESPGPDKESNWLPAPASGPFTMNLRLYWPKSEILTGAWSPPGVKRVQ